MPTADASGRGTMESKLRTAALEVACNLTVSGAETLEYVGKLREALDLTFHEVPGFLEIGEATLMGVTKGMREADATFLFSFDREPETPGFAVDQDTNVETVDEAARGKSLVPESDDEPIRIDATDNRASTGL